VHLDGNTGYRVITSVVEDAILGRTKYYVTENGTSIIGSEYSNATYRYPLSVAGLNAQVSGANYDNLPTVTGGATISATGTLTTAMTAPVAGASGSVFTVRGGNWTGGMTLDKAYWKVFTGNYPLDINSSALLLSGGLSAETADGATFSINKTGGTRGAMLPPKGCNK
jgi:hypothetical protein